MTQVLYDTTTILYKYVVNLLGTGVLHLIQINHQPDATGW